MTVRFVSRGAIGLQSANPTRLRLRTAQEMTSERAGITVHHTGSDGNLFRPDPTARLRAIQAYHMGTLGYGDIAYEGAFDADGNTYELRADRWVGAHAASTDNLANRTTDGVCFLEDARGITSDALHAFTWWCDVFRVTFRRTPGLWAHRWWGEGHGGLPTSCPGDDWDRVVRFLHGNA